MLQRCRSAFCLASLSVFKQVFNGDLQKVKVLDAYLLRSDGTQVKVPPSAITDRRTDQGEAAPSFSSLRELEVKYDGAKIGDGLYLKLEILTKRPTFDGRFDTLELFPLVYDWKLIEINVSTPIDYQVFIDAVGLEGGKLPDQNGRSIWQFRRRDVSAIELEPVMHDIAGISPRVALTTFRTPEELGAAFWDNVKRKAIVTPQVQALADEITKNKPTASQQTSAIYDWVNKNIRYLSIVLDRGGWIPHSSTEIIKNGYGDCKDYVTIIHALLKAKGIESVPVLIRSDIGDWFPSVATADYFNHVILYIPGLNVFADATAPNTRLGLVSQTIVGKRGILAGEKTGIIQVPRDNPLDNQIVSDLNIEFGENGSVKARTKNTYIGRSEIIFRPLFGESSARRYSEDFVRYLLAYFGIQGSGNIINVGNPFEVGEPFTVELDARIDNYTTFLPKGRLALPPGVNMINMAGMEQLVTTPARKTSIVVGATKVTENVTVRLPAKVIAVSTRSSVNFSNAVGSFRLLPEVKNDTVRFTRELVIAKDVIEPKDYPMFRELIRKLMESHEVEIEYTADATLLRAKSRELRSMSSGRSKDGSRYNDVAGDLGDFELSMKLTPAAIARLEKKLIADPNDVTTRLTLIRHYSFVGNRKKNTAESAHLRHRLWLIENRPEIEDMTLYGLSDPGFSQASLEALKTAWIRRVEKAKDASNVRLNAIAFLQSRYPDAAEKPLGEAIALEPQNYKLLLLMTELKIAEIERADSTEQRATAGRQLVEHGRRALGIIKRERSEERDADRGPLLKRLCVGAIESNDLESASLFALELVLDYGQKSSDRGYDQAAHVGNITLGLVELRKNNIQKAKEYLMIAIRAPLRKDYNSLGKIDMMLAKELFERGEKATVVEYLKLCLELGNLKTYPESFAVEIAALKLWKEQILKGMKPSFDFKKP